DAMGRSTLRVTNYDNPDNLGNPTYTDPDTWSWDGTQWIDGASTPVVISHGVDADQNLISEMVYNKGGEMLTTRDVHGTFTAFAYDDMGRRVQVTQAQGTPLETTSYTCFDKSGRVRRQVMNVNTTADLDARAGGEWVVVPTGHGGDNDTDVVTETVYDRASRPVQRINPVGDVVETAYFKNGQVATVTHKDVLVEGAVQDVVMLYRYDALYRRTLVVQNYVDQGGVDPANWVFESGVWKTGPSGTTIVHDPTSSGNASQNIIVQANYDKSGRTVSLRDPNGNVTDYEYDQLGRRTKLSNPLGYEWLMAYEDVGETSRVTMTYPGIEEVSSVWQSYDVQQDFDRLGRLTEVIYPDADVTPDVVFSYDVSGNRTAMLETDAASATVRETQYSYDAMNRMVQMQLDRDGDGNIDEAVQYSYDERGLRTQLVIDPSGDNLQVTYVYDEKRRLVALTDWDAQTTSYDYDRMNRHTDTLHPNGVQSRYDYDVAGRLQHLRHRDGRDTLAAFKYETDARGNRVKTWEILAGETRTVVAGDAEVTERGTWATNGLLHETTQWDAALTLTVWGHEDVKLTIGTGPENSIFDIYIDGTLYISPDGYAATPGEREISFDIRDKQIRQHVIKLRNRHEKNLASNGHKLQFKQLTLGKVQQIDYDYDALSRVLRADYADNSRSYAYLYDLAGNRLQEAVTIGITTTVTDWTYDDANRVNTMQVGSNPVDTFGYDANGNLLSAGGHAYEWNHAGRMTHLDTGAGIYHYTYDGDDNRLSQRLGATTTEYLLDMQPGLAEVLRESDGTTTSHYIHGPRGVQAVEQTNTWTLLLQDGLGSVRAQVDSTADVDATQHHSPYGQPFDLVGTWTGSFGYAGEQIDPTGLSYNRARYYDPNMGMFTALDPFEGMMADPMSMNGYSYVHGNPVNLTDPSGEIPQALIGTVVGGILGGVTG
ncbi:MAG: RHS repeat-associated core domain-containing protein, partial [Chloroflexota bacterium]